jgi:hypothetical protein
MEAGMVIVGNAILQLMFGLDRGFHYGDLKDCWVGKCDVLCSCEYGQEVDRRYSSIVHRTLVNRVHSKHSLQSRGHCHSLSWTTACYYHVIYYY